MLGALGEHLSSLSTTQPQIHPELWGKRSGKSLGYTLALYAGQGSGMVTYMVSLPTWSQVSILMLRVALLVLKHDGLKA